MDQDQQPRQQSFISELVLEWRRIREQRLWMARVTIVLIVLFVLLGILTLIGLPFEITLWEWLKLLAVPITVGGAVPLLNKLQKDRELKVQGHRAQDEALQAYLGEMGHLLLEKGLRDSHEHGDGAYTDKSNSRENDNVRTLARSRTLTVVRTLDSDQKRSVLDFLYESKLITPPKPLPEPEQRRRMSWWLGGQSKRSVPPSTVEPNKPKPIVDLGGIDSFGGAADLSGANLKDDHLVLADLHGANLTKANLRKAKLRKSTLHECDLSKADLREADLREADLQVADLREAKLSGALLNAVDLNNANLTRADLSGANLTDANLLSGADLTGAVLTGAIGVTAQQLVGKGKSRAGATMPNGQKYEDWLKDKKVINCRKEPDPTTVQQWAAGIFVDVKKLKYKEGRKEDGENSGPSQLSLERTSEKPD